MSEERKGPYREHGPAWEAARAFGFDLSLIETNLELTPAERVRKHSRALAMAIALREAGERSRA